MDMRIAGKTAVVTASSKGLGRAIAQGLAEEGVNVVISARTKEPLEQAAKEIAAIGGHVLPVVADVASSTDCERIVAAAEQEFGCVDILVTNTGGPAKGSFDDCDDAMWAAGVESTLMNVIRLVRLVAPGMKERRWGRIVNVTSITAKQPIKGLTISNAVRPAVIGLAKDLSDELAPHGVLVNNVCPGLHRTDRLLHLAKGATVDDPETYFEKLAADVPLGRIGDPRELADAVVFLCSQRASFITGTSLVVDGGHCRGIG
ncbi:MAG: SDR family oxidoreductase [Phycisphaerales bacterium]|nr:SDR family oxidoreductase [Phycisphaerales bacterium]